MSTSLNSNSKTSPSSLEEDGQDVYERRLRATLEGQHAGEFVAIEPGTGRYFLGETATAALVSARNAMPESQFFLTRVSSSSAHKIGGHGSRIR